jgi:hypothetical protein
VVQQLAKIAAALDRQAYFVMNFGIGTLVSSSHHIAGWGELASGRHRDILEIKSGGHNFPQRHQNCFSFTPPS